MSRCQRRGRDRRARRARARGAGGVSSPSGDVDGAEEAIALCAALLPPEAADRAGAVLDAGQRPGPARPDRRAAAARRLLLLGHVDTVISHDAHAPLRRDGDRLYGPGTADMKGGVVLSLGVARALAARPERSPSSRCCSSPTRSGARTRSRHVERFAGYDACLCFEAGRAHARRGGGRRRAPQGRGHAAGPRPPAAPPHSGSAPDKGRNALLALAQTALTSSPRSHDPTGPSG